MKTIYTTLPIYDKLSKQCFERGKHAGNDKPIPIVCPRHRLPSFQWKDGTDGATSITKVELISTNPTVSNQVVTWVSAGSYDIFITSGFNITSAVASGESLTASTYISLKSGQQIRITGTLVLNSGAAPYLYAVATPSGAIYQIFNLSVGANDIVFTNLTGATVSYYIMIRVAAASNFTFTSTSTTILNDHYNITSFFASLPTTHAITGDVYFVYDGDTLNYLLSVGKYYLKITMNNGYIYYSDWFKVDCIYENLLSGLSNAGYETFTTNGTAIVLAIETGASGQAVSPATISVIKNEIITVILNDTHNSGQYPTIVLWSTLLGGCSAGVALVDGLNIINLTCTQTAQDVYFSISNNAAAEWSATEIMLMRHYSTKYLTINFHNDCDLGEILYHNGFTQSLWVESEAMEQSYPEEEEGVKNGDGRFVRTFARQVKKYLARTNLMPDYMVDVFNRMKLHDNIELIDILGDTNDVYNLEVEHEWTDTDKYYAKIELTFDYDEAVVIAGCCNNLI